MTIPMTEEEFFSIWQNQASAVHGDPEYRLYYDENGFPLFFSMESLPGNYIVVDQETYLNSPKHIRVFDGKLVVYQTNFAKKIKPFLKWSMATAAVLIGLAVCIQYVNSNKNNLLDIGNNYNEIIAKRGTKTKIILPDGSQVWLNSDSKLSYGARFNDTIREVSLEGEAYFDVIKDKNRPFVVMTNALNIRVLGTAFNIKSYAQDATIETTLIRGMIEVRKNNEPATKKIVLTPNEKLIYNKSEALLVRPNNEQNTIAKKLEALSITTLSKNIPDSSRVETAWIYGRLVFDGDSFVTLAEKMERWYNIKITIQNQSISNSRFSGVFEKENVDEAFKALQLITMFKYDIHENEILIK